MKDTYFHVSILPGHRKFRIFIARGDHFQFTILPFSHSSALRFFMKCMAVVTPYLHYWMSGILLPGCLAAAELLPSGGGETYSLNTPGVFMSIPGIYHSTHPENRIYWAVLDSTLTRAFLPPVRLITIRDLCMSLKHQ